MLFRAKVVNMTTLIGAKSAHKQLILIFTKDFEGSRGPRGRQDCEQVSEPRHFGVILGSFLVSESDFGSLGVHFEIIA